MIRAGAVLPMLPPDVDTLASYGKGRGIVRLDERRDRMVLLAFPRGRSRAAFGEREHLVSRAGRHRWSLAIHGKRARSYRVRASLGSMRRPFVPASVSVAGRTLPARDWSYDERKRLLTFAAKVREGRIVVRSRRIARTSAATAGLVPHRRRRVAPDQVAGAAEDDVAGVVPVALGRIEMVAPVGLDHEASGRPEEVDLVAEQRDADRRGAGGRARRRS